MAADMAGLVEALGFERAAVVGHDRGARVGHRWALDRPEQVDRLAVLDIVPTREMFRRLDASLASGCWHRLFHMQPDLPERRRPVCRRWTSGATTRTTSRVPRSRNAATSSRRGARPPNPAGRSTVDLLLPLHLRLWEPTPLPSFGISPEGSSLDQTNWSKQCYCACAVSFPRCGGTRTSPIWLHRP